MMGQGLVDDMSFNPRCHNSHPTYRSAKKFTQWAVKLQKNPLPISQVGKQRPRTQRQLEPGPRQPQSLRATLPVLTQQVTKLPNASLLKCWMRESRGRTFTGHLLGGVHRVRHSYTRKIQHTTQPFPKHHPHFADKETETRRQLDSPVPPSSSAS